MKQGDKIWKTAIVDRDRVSVLSKETGVPVPIVSVLVSRGIDRPDMIERFMNPRLSDLSDPFLIPGMRLAVDRIWQAIDLKQNIVIHGDFDADGVTATALMVKVLRKLGANVEFFLPNRIKEGYGLSRKGLERCFSGAAVQLVVTVDCGTNAVAALEFAASRGVEVVVTDHHEVSGPTEPVVAVVNPKLEKNPAVESLAGVGVAFKVCHALIKDGIAKTRPEVSGIDLRDYLDIVAAGTVADVVPLTGENRILVKHGLLRLNAAPNIGLKALVDVAGAKNAIDCYHLGFVVGPRLNAAGRMDSAEPALELLLTDDSGCAADVAEKLDVMNRERKKEEEVIVDEAVSEIDGYFDDSRTFGIVVGRQGWHVGIIGIVAAGICGKYRRPAVVVGFDDKGMGRGSCRSIECLDVVEILRDCSDLLVSYGGHKMAAGLSIEEKCYDEFRRRFDELCAQRLIDCDLSRVYHVDAWLGLSEADDGFLEVINKLKPCGLGNPAPVWGVRSVSVVGKPRIVGNDHLKMVVASGGTQRDCIGFDMGDREVPEGQIDVLFGLQENMYMGRRTIQLNLKDFRSACIESLL